MSQTTDFTVNQIIVQYYQRYADYGIENASLWLADNLPREYVDDFKRLQPKVAKRYGFKHER